MESELPRIRGKRFLLTIINAAAFGVFFSIFLLTTSFGQTQSDRGQKTLEVEVISQTDCPILITMIGVDNSAESYQTVNFVVQNISDKNIKASVLLHAGQKDSGAAASTTSFFSSFAAGQMIQASVFEERANIRNGKKFLSFDYVEFEDGSSWGTDSQKMSEHIAGMKEGQKNAVNQIRDLAGNRNKKALSELFLPEISEIKPPDVGTTESEKWRRGFSSGYKSMLWAMKFAYEKQGLEAITLKLEEIEKSMNRKNPK